MMGQYYRTFDYSVTASITTVSYPLDTGYSLAVPLVAGSIPMHTAAVERCLVGTYDLVGTCSQLAGLQCYQ